MSSDHNVVETVIQRFGGLTAMSRALGHENPTTVQGWQTRRSIPYAHWPLIERAAAEKGFADITATWLAIEHAKLAVAKAGVA